MCIAIFSPKNIFQTKQILENCWRTNKDGAGYMYANNGKIIIKKELESFDKFFSMYEEDWKENQDRNFVIHFRFKTHGSVNLDNTHPFMIQDDIAFCHNGIINIETYEDKSDTRVFGEGVLEYIPNLKEMIQNPGLQFLIESSIGWSKLIFLDNEGDVTILNERDGIWETDGSWYSNNGYLNTYQVVKKGTGSKYHDWKDDWSGMYDKTDDEKYYTYDDYKKNKNGIKKYTGYDTWQDEECEYCYYPLESYKELENGCCNRCLELFLSGNEELVFEPRVDYEEK